jgi:hypothetical protein
MGIQWHPEFGASDLGPKIAASVTEAAKAYSRSKSQQSEVAPVGSRQWARGLLQSQQDAVLAR